MISDMPPRFPPGLGRGNNILNTLQNQRLVGECSLLLTQSYVGLAMMVSVVWQAPQDM